MTEPKHGGSEPEGSSLVIEDERVRQQLSDLGVPKPLHDEVLQHPGSDFDESLGCLWMIVVLPAMFGVWLGVGFVWKIIDRSNGAILSDLGFKPLLIVVLGIPLIPWSLIRALVLQETVSTNKEKARKYAAARLRTKVDDLVAPGQKHRKLLIKIEDWFRKWAAPRAAKNFSGGTDYLLNYTRSEARLAWRLTGAFSAITLLALLPLTVWTIEGRDYIVRSFWFRVELDRKNISDVSRVITGCRTVNGRHGKEQKIQYKLVWPDGFYQPLGIAYSRDMTKAQALERVSNMLSETVEHAWVNETVLASFTRACFQAYSSELTPNGHARLERILRVRFYR